MPALLSCSKGHRWEPATPGKSGDQPSHCPFCGASPLGSEGQNATLEFTPPVADDRTRLDASPLPVRATPSTLPEETLAVDGTPPPARAAAPEETLASDGAPPAAVIQDTLVFSESASPSASAPTLGEADSPPFEAEPGSGMPGVSAVGDATFSVADVPHAQAKTVRMKMRPTAYGRGPVPSVPGYEILGELGRGGMGVVYKARQKGLERIVALKMILAGGHASATELARFRTEGQAVAKLHHPNIVQIYDVGELDGCPYFSLEYLDGGNLAEKIVESPLPAAQAAQSVRALADAMECAHRGGIVHRDLKPANVLLATDGTPKITDFGLAKRIEADTGQTRTGAVLGTPSYMAPEQAEGRIHEIGPSTDIYSLGAVLYDLVTGRPPFRGESVLDTLEQVRRIEPVPPSRFRTALPRDLDTICLKCLQKDSRKRYSSAGALAEDLRRFLDGEPITARPTPAWERGLKWTKRHPAIAALIAVSVLALVGFGAGGVAWAIHADSLRASAEEERQEADRQRLRAEENESIANVQRAKAEDERQRAASNFRDARAAVDQMLTRIGQERLANEPKMDLVRRDLLERALRFHQRFLQAQSDNPEVRWEAGQAYIRVADIQEMLGQTAKGEQSYLQATALLQELADQFPDRSEFHRDLAAAHANRAFILQSAGRGLEAEKAEANALRIRQRLIEQNPTSRTYKWDLADGHNRRGLQAKDHNRLTEAKESFGKAITLFAELVRDFSDQAEYEMDLARAHVNLAAVFQALQQTKAAETEYRQAVPTLRQLVDKHREVREYRQELARALLNFATLLHLDRRFENAETAYKEAVALFTALAEEYPTVPDFRYFLASCSNNFADLLLNTRKAGEAEQHWRQAGERFAQLAREYPALPIYRQEQAKTLHNLGALYNTTNQSADAIKVLTSAVELRRKLADEYPAEPEPRQLLAASTGEHAIALARDNQLKQSVEQFRKAIELLEKLETEHANVPAYKQDQILQHGNLAGLLDALGNGPDAEKSRRRIAELKKKLDPASR